jgi:hypothetical protein
MTERFRALCALRRSEQEPEPRGSPQPQLFPTVDPNRRRIGFSISRIAALNEYYARGRYCFFLLN